MVIREDASLRYQWGKAGYGGPRCIDRTQHKEKGEEVRISQIDVDRTN
jgi:hypothetical protein